MIVKISLEPYGVFEKIKKSPKWQFFGNFWANLGCFSDPSHTILMTVQNLIEKIVWTLFEKLKFSLKGRRKKYDCVSSRNFLKRQKRRNSSTGKCPKTKSLTTSSRIKTFK